MKRATLIGVSALTLLLSSCGDGAEKKANERLEAARVAFAHGDYNDAKIQLDSIKILFPKAFEARRQGIVLMQQVELKEQQESLVYLDSMMQAKQEQFDAIKSKFTFEKNEEYQRIGNYFWPTQTIEKSLHRSFLRFQVNEQGVMTMTSIYCGPSFIHHLAVKVIAPDGTFAETPASKDSYETTDLDEKIEKADFKMGDDGNLMSFLYLNRDKKIKVEYLGGKKYSYQMAPNDMAALTNIYELAQILSAIDHIKKEQEEAQMKIQFIEKNMSEREEKETTQ